MTMTLYRLLGMTLVLGACSPTPPDVPSDDAGRDTGADAVGDIRSPSDTTDDVAEPVDTADATSDDFVYLQENLFPTCVNDRCHVASNPIVDLSPDIARENIVNEPSEQVPQFDFVEPGSPEDSYLFLKLAGRQGEACERSDLDPMRCGSRMPLVGFVRAESFDTLRRWIADGAP